MRKVLHAATATILAAGLSLGAAVTAPAIAGTGLDRGTPPYHRGCSPHDRTARHESMLQFARHERTTPDEVVGQTFRCYFGLPPKLFAAYVNAGDWHRSLPAHVRLFYGLPIAGS